MNSSAVIGVGVVWLFIMFRLWDVLAKYCVYLGVSGNAKNRIADRQYRNI